MLNEWKLFSLMSVPAAHCLCNHVFISQVVLVPLSQFFNQVLVMGKSSVSDLSEHVFDLIQELFAIDPMLLTSVMPQLEFKLKVNTTTHTQTVKIIIAICVIYKTVFTQRTQNTLLRAGLIQPLATLAYGKKGGSRRAVPNLFWATDRFRVRNYFHGPAI